MKNLIAITIGDIEGIGIHLLLKEWLKGNIKNFILITNFKILSKTNILNQSKVNIIKIPTYFKDKDVANDSLSNSFSK